MRRPLVLALAVALVGVAGCGGSSKRNNDYIDAVNKAQNTFAATFDRLQGQISATSTVTEDRQTLAQFQAATDRVISDLKAVKPPNKVKSLHGELIHELTAYDEAIKEASRSLGAKRARQIAAAQTKLTTAVTNVSQQINDTIQKINAKLHE
jgi:hypothetical protein